MSYCPVMSDQSSADFAPPAWFSRLSAFGLALLRPFLPAKVIGWLDHAAWFIAVGGFNTLMSYLLFVMAIKLLGLGKGGALMVGYGLGMLIAYQNFSRFVFKGGASDAWLRFAPGYVVLFFANWGLLALLVYVSGWSEVLSQFLLLPVVAALSYIINRFMVFRV